MPEGDIADIFIVDDDPGIRQSMRAIFESSGFRVHAFGDGATFLAKVDHDSAGTVLLDVCLPGLSGLQVLRRLAEQDSGMDVLVITGHADVPTAVEAMKLGAIDVLEKPVSPGMLVDRVQALSRDSEGVQVGEREAAQVEAEIVRSLESVMAQLTEREREVLGMLVKGVPNKEVGYQLGISEKTVSTHRQHILSKAGVGGLTQLVYLMGRAGIRLD